MSTPKGETDLWKNCIWRDRNQKLAFFNHYFKDSKFVSEIVNEKIDEFRDPIVRLARYGKITEKGKERDLTIQDLIMEIEK